MQANKTFSKIHMLCFIAWRNVWRNPVRSALTIFSLSAGLALVLLYTAILEGMTRQMAEFATDISTGHIQIHRQAFIDNQDVYAVLPWKYLDEFENKFPHLDFSPRLYAAGLASTHEHSTGIFIKAIDAEKEKKATRLLEQVKEGVNDLDKVNPILLENLSQETQALQLYPVLIGTQLAKNHQILPGDELILVTQAIDGSIGNGIFIVNGIFKSVDPIFDRTGVLMSVEAFQGLMYLEDGFHELVIHTEDGTDLEQIQQQVQEQVLVLNQNMPLDELGGNAVVRSWREISKAVADMLEISKTMIWIIGFIIVALSSLGVLNTVLMAVHERTIEFGILLAIGMKGRWLLFMVLMESLYLGLVASFAGCVSGVLIIFSLGEGIDYSRFLPDGFDFGGMIFEPILKLHLEYHYLWMISLLLVCVTILAGLIPSLKTISLKPAEVL